MKLARYHTTNQSMLHTIESKLAKHHTIIFKIKLEEDVQPKRFFQYDGKELEYDETKLEYDTKNNSMLNKIRMCCYNFDLIVKRRSLNILSYSNFVSSYYKILFVCNIL